MLTSNHKESSHFLFRWDQLLIKHVPQALSQILALIKICIHFHFVEIAYLL